MTPSRPFSVRRPGLRPFKAGDPRTVAAGRRGVAAREAKRAVARATVQAAAAHLRSVAEVHDREQLGEHAAAAGDLIARISTGEIPVRNGDEAAFLIQPLWMSPGWSPGRRRVRRLSLTSARTLRPRVLSLRDQARQALGTLPAALDVDREVEH
jgi:hypothetical protein